TEFESPYPNTVLIEPLRILQNLRLMWSDEGQLVSTEAAFDLFNVAGGIHDATLKDAGDIDVEVRVMDGVQCSTVDPSHWQAYRLELPKLTLSQSRICHTY
ncbi:hypothetical protein STEG23_002172, partial [Scotinomys teguina]